MNRDQYWFDRLCRRASCLGATDEQRAATRDITVSYLDARMAVEHILYLRHALELINHDELARVRAMMPVVSAYTEESDGVAD